MRFMFGGYNKERTLSGTEMSAYIALLSSHRTELHQINSLMLDNKAEWVTPYLVDAKKRALTALSNAWIKADVKCVGYQEAYRIRRTKLYWCMVSASLPIIAIMLVLLLALDQNTGLSLIAVTSLSFLSTFMWGIFELLRSHQDVQNAEGSKLQLAVRIAEEAGLDLTPNLMFWPKSDSKHSNWEYYWSSGQFSASSVYHKYCDKIMPHEAQYLSEYLLHVWTCRMFSGDILTLDTILKDKGFNYNDLHFGKFNFPLLPFATDAT